MISRTSLMCLQECFDYLDQIQMQAEQIKEQIWNNTKMEPYSIWRLLANPQDQLSISSMQNQFKDIPIEGLNAIFVFFDSDFDDNLSYEDFFKLCIPFDNKIIRIQASISNECNTEKYSAQLIKPLIIHYANGFQILYEYIQNVHECYDFNLYQFYYNLLEHIELSVYAQRLLFQQDQVQFLHFYKLFRYPNNFIVIYHQLQNEKKTIIRANLLWEQFKTKFILNKNKNTIQSQSPKKQQMSPNIYQSNKVTPVRIIHQKYLSAKSK